jgi:Transcriptional regulators
VTRHLDRLEREGLVTRSRDLEDRRQISVELTAAGKALHRGSAPSRDDWTTGSART